MVSHLELFGFLDLCFQHSGINPWEPKANKIDTTTISDEKRAEKRAKRIAKRDKTNTKEKREALKKEKEAKS